MTIAEMLEARGEARGETIGFARGKAIGEAKALATIAKRMLNEGAEIAFIAKITGLTTEQIQRLQ